jgi:hypothetical protein
MPHYVTKLGEKFLLPIMQIFNLDETLLGIQKLFGALAKWWQLKCKTAKLNVSQKVRDFNN